jgi:DNA-directed RNA polymerase subunit RPC12/RpoP
VPTEFVTVGSYSTSYEANLVKSGLDAFGIHAILIDEHTINANWVWSNLLGGVKVQVSESEIEDARRLIQAEPADEQDEKDAWADTGIACPTCSSSNTRYFLDKRESFLTWLVLGFPALPTVSKRACTNCGHKWRI